MSGHSDKEVLVDGEIMYEIYTPWWRRFGRVGSDGLTMLERNYIAKQFMRETGRKGKR